MDIIYACDESYAWITAASIASLLDNGTDDPSRIHIWLLGEGISDNSAAALASVVRGCGGTFTLVPTDELEIPRAAASRWPKVAYARLLASELLPSDVGVAVYLDCDTIVLRGLDSLEGFDAGERSFAGVLECVGAGYRRNIGLRSDAPYVSAGVLRMDVARMRGLGMRARIESFVDRFGRFATYADQDILNGAFQDELAVLPDPRYNLTTQYALYSASELRLLRRPVVAYGEAQLALARQEPHVVHYTTCMLTARPWFSNSDHPYRSQFLHYLSETPFACHNLAEWHPSTRRDGILRALSALPPGLRMTVVGVAHAWVSPAATRFRGLVGGRK